MEQKSISESHGKQKDRNDHQSRQSPNQVHHPAAEEADAEGHPAAGGLIQKRVIQLLGG